jgi:predicted RNase H-like nuclease (RuvC/YqgF family)
MTEQDKKTRAGRSSDRPPEDLLKERDAFIQQFFRKGAQLTEELLKENERLRDQVGALEADNATLRTHVASEGAIRELLQKVEQLEREKSELLSRTARVEPAQADYAPMFEEVERELANFASLYVATAQLHTARSVRGVLRALSELLTQLLGAAAFAVYFVSDDGKELVALTSEGVDRARVARVSAEEGPVARAFASGEITYVQARDISKTSIDEPAALVPLHLGEHVQGVIAIFGTLPQKPAFVATDADLFKLLDAQAARALVNARLFTEAGRKSPAIRAFIDPED